jgi:hypothetical protein
MELGQTLEDANGHEPSGARATEPGTDEPTPATGRHGAAPAARAARLVRARARGVRAGVAK